MTPVTDIINTKLTADELALLPVDAVSDVVTESLKKYSLQKPQQLIQDLSIVVAEESKTGYSQMPEFWAENFSRIKLIELNPDNVTLPTEPPILSGGGEVDVYQNGELVVDNATAIDMRGDVRVVDSNGTAVITTPAPQFSITSLTIAPSSIEKGQQLDSVQVSWNLSSQPTEQSLNDVPLSVDSRNHNVTTIPTDLTFILSATSEIGSDTKTKTIQELTMNYWGRGGATFNSLDDLVAMQSQLDADRNATLNFDANPLGDPDAAGYLYILYPTAKGQAMLKDTNNIDITSAFLSPSAVSITNQFEVVLDYYVYRSVNKLNGAYTVVVT